MRAYGGAVAQCLDRASLETVIPTLPLWLRYSYNDTNNVESALLGLNLAATETLYGEHVDARLQIPDQQIIDVYKALGIQVGGRLELTLPAEIAEAIDT